MPDRVTPLCLLISLVVDELFAKTCTTSLHFGRHLRGGKAWLQWSIASTSELVKPYQDTMPASLVGRHVDYL